MNDGKITYRQQIAYCGKPRCRKCRDGIGHGPYWYAYRTENGVTIRTYVGKHLPPEAQAQVETLQEQAQDAGHAALTTLTVNMTGLNYATVRLFVLGQFRLERRRGQQWLPVIDAGWQEQSLRTLLGYLISSPARTIRRRHAMAALWPDLDIDTAANRLNGAVHELRQILEPEIARPATSHMLRLERDVLKLADRAV